mmetsp:Transcript_22068/g.59327  ORF Transcript_22068/g.59327 Transcript_22068/m.59327 type:complete len:225 (-) Transcript_22068:608-1282(-)
MACCNRRAGVDACWLYMAWSGALSVDARHAWWWAAGAARAAGRASRASRGGGQPSRGGPMCAATPPAQCSRAAGAARLLTHHRSSERRLGRSRDAHLQDLLGRGSRLGLRAHHRRDELRHTRAATSGRGHGAVAQVLPVRAAAGEHLARLDLVQHDTEREDVGCRRRARLEQVAREVARVALLLIPSLKDGRVAEVANLEDALAADQDVVRLEVAVKDFVRVDV